MTGFLTKDITSGSNWRGLERAVGRLMQHAGWTDVQIVGGTGDEGGDILATRTDNQGKTSGWVVQVKAKTSGYVGVSAIDQAINALSAYKADIAAIATNADFVKSAVTRQKGLVSNGFDTKLWNGAFLTGLWERLPEKSNAEKALRPYQREIVNSAIKAFCEAKKKAFFVVATGLGKTVIAASLAQWLWDKGYHKILVLCHATDLAIQLEQSFWPALSKFIPTSVFYNGLPPKIEEGISFGLFQSLRVNLGGLKRDEFDVIIVDEAHHACAQGFSQVLNHFSPVFLIGMTATPWRGDGQSIEEMFGEPLAKVSLVDGMEMGYLSRVDYRIFCDNIQWEELPKLANKRISIRDLNKRLFVPQRDTAIIDELKRVCSTLVNPRIAVFSPSLEHCDRFAAMLNAESIPCAALTSPDKIERRKKLLGFSTGRFSAITAVDQLNEGIDVPDVNVLVFLRATHSRRIFVQQLGRGLRLAEDKEKVIVLDFVSDIRRIADVINLNNEGKEKGAKNEVVYLKEGIVTFSSPQMERFTQRWLQDVADLATTEDDSQLTFPTFSHD